MSTATDLIEKALAQSKEPMGILEEVLKERDDLRKQLKRKK